VSLFSSTPLRPRPIPIPTAAMVSMITRSNQIVLTILKVIVEIKAVE
jgi:hypothetical protein